MIAEFVRMFSFGATLEASKTWPYRAFTWVLLPGLDNPILTITLGRSPENVKRVNTYEVEESPGTPDVRVFQIHKRESADVYETVIGKYQSCTCRAGQSKLKCVHQESLSKICAHKDNEGL